MSNSMWKYTIQRLFWVIPVIFITTALVFSLIHVMPGSPAEVILPKSLLTPRYIGLVEQEYGLDRPIYVQYLSWLWDLLHGDLGTSFMKNEPVANIISIGLRRTLLLGLVAVVISIAVSIPLGILSAVYKDTWIDEISRFGSISGISVPEFWVALMAILIFAQMWSQWFGSPLIPSQGYVRISESLVGWARHTIGPAVVLSIPYTAVLIRVTRSSMVDVLNREYITTARSKGLEEGKIVTRHAVKNAMIPVVTIGAYQGAAIFNGSVLVETVFAYPGLGWYTYSAALNQDFPLLMGIMIVIVLVFVTLNFLADITYTWLDPRIDYEGEH